MREWNIIVLLRCVCACTSGLEIIYIQVAYLTAPVARRHSTPPYLNSTTHKSSIHTPGLCSIFAYNHHTGWLSTQSLFSAATLSHAHIFLVPFSLSIPHPSAHIPSLSHEFSECSSFSLCKHNIPVGG